MSIRLLKIFFFVTACNFINQSSYNEYNQRGPSQFRDGSFLYIKDSLPFQKEYKVIDSLFKEQKEYGLALERALILYTRVKGNPELRFQSALQIGNIYGKTSNFRRSLDFYKKALKILTYAKDINNNLTGEFNEQYVETLLRLGGIYQRLNLKDSAMIYYEKVEEINLFSKKGLSYKAMAYSNISGILQLDSLYTEAEKYSIKSLAIHRQNGDMLNQASALNNLGSIYLSQGNFKQAKEKYLEGIELIKENNSHNAVRYKADLYANLAWAMRNLKEYKAYDALEDSYLIKDRLKDKEIQQIVETVTKKHNVKAVKKQAEVEAAIASRRTWVIGGGSTLAILALLFFVNYYKLKQKNLALKLRQKEADQERKISKLREESQTRILNAILDGREAERKEVAEILHDNVSALLSSANLHIQACKTHFNGETPPEVGKTQVIINEASQKIRDLSHTLVSSILLKFGLSHAIRDMIEKYENSQLHIHSSIDKLPRYNEKFEIKVYNIIQELFNNIIKHSKASKVGVDIFEAKKRVFIKITDNGVGFDASTIAKKEGVGINQINARVYMMNGKFDIDSKINQGTTIEVMLPVVPRNQKTTA